MPESGWKGRQGRGKKKHSETQMFLYSEPTHQGVVQAAYDRQSLHTSAFKPYTGQEAFQSFKFLVGFLDGTVSLHIASDVEADVVDQGNGVGLLPFLHSLCVLLHSSHKLLQLHQLGRVDKSIIRKTRQQIKTGKGLG